MEFTSDVKAVLSGNLGLHVQEWPSKKGWGFVGTVPADLLYRMADGSAPSVEIITEMRQASMPAMVMKIYGVQHRGFASKADAIAYAIEHGYQVCQQMCCK
jgi:hypothetical protein